MKQETGRARAVRKRLTADEQARMLNLMARGWRVSDVERLFHVGSKTVYRVRKENNPERRAH